MPFSTAQRSGIIVSLQNDDLYKCILNSPWIWKLVFYISYCCLGIIRNDIGRVGLFVGVSDVHFWPSSCALHAVVATSHSSLPCSCVSPFRREYQFTVGRWFKRQTSENLGYQHLTKLGCTSNEIFLMRIGVRVRCINCKVVPWSPQPNPAVANIKTSIAPINGNRVSLPCSME